METHKHAPFTAAINHNNVEQLSSLLSSQFASQAERLAFLAAAFKSQRLSYRSLLHYAIAMRAAACVVVLVQHGASVRPGTSQAGTMLVSAVRANNTELVGALINGNTVKRSQALTALDQAVDLKLKEPILVLAEAFSAHDEAIARAVHNRSLQLVRWLLDEGASASTNSAVTPLHILCTHNIFHASSPKLATLLLANGADPNAKNRSGATPVDLALLNGMVDIATVLLAAGGIVRRSDALLRAVKGDKPAMVELLLAHGADPNVSDRKGITSLIAAARKPAHSHTLIRLLLDAGADANLASDANVTPLHAVLANPATSLEAVNLLLHAGSDVNAHTASLGLTPLHLAVRQPINILQTVLAHKPNLFALTRIGETALSMARSSRSTSHITTLAAAMRAEQLAVLLVGMRLGSTAAHPLLDFNILRIVSSLLLEQ